MLSHEAKPEWQSSSVIASFNPYMPKEIDLVVDFGGGAGEFAEYC